MRLAGAELRAGFDADMAALLAMAKLQAPTLGRCASTGKRGVHSEHMGRRLAQMQALQRSFPGGLW